jgi:hypothetical protein
MAYGKLSVAQVREIDFQLSKLKNKMIKESGFVFKESKKNLTPIARDHEIDKQLAIFDKDLLSEIRKEKSKLRKKLTKQMQQKNGDKLKSPKIKKKRFNYLKN